MKPFVRNYLKIGIYFIDVDNLVANYTHLEQISMRKLRNADVEMRLGPGVFHYIRPLEYFEYYRGSTPIADRLLLGWILSGPLFSATSLFSTCSNLPHALRTRSNGIFMVTPWKRSSTEKKLQQIHQAGFRKRVRCSK